MEPEMKIVEAMQLKEDLKRNIESMMLIYSAATGLDIDVQGSSGTNADGSTFSECTLQVNLPDKSPLATEPSTG